VKDFIVEKVVELERAETEVAAYEEEE